MGQANLQQISVAHVLHNPFTNDSRVLKELHTLSSLAEIKSIHLICLQAADLPSRDQLTEKIQILRLSKPKFDPRLFFLKGMGFAIWLSKALQVLKKQTPDVIHCHDLPGICVGFFYKLLIARTRIIYDSHEFQTEVSNLKGLRQKIIQCIERLAIFAADRFITVSPSIAANYQYLYGVKRPLLVLNCPVPTEVSQTNLLKENCRIPSDHLLFLYQGGFSPGRGIELMLSAFDQLRGTKMHIVFMGFGPLQDEIIRRSKSNANVHFFPAVPPHELLAYTASADFGICLTDRSCRNHLFCLPNKLFEYINAGIPVIANDLLEVRKIVEAFEIGVLVEEETVECLTKRLQEAAENSLVTRKNMPKAAGVYNWNTQIPNLIAAYKDLSRQ